MLYLKGILKVFHIIYLIIGLRKRLLACLCIVLRCLPLLVKGRLIGSLSLLKICGARGVVFWSTLLNALNQTYTVPQFKLSLMMCVLTVLVI